MPSAAAQPRRNFHRLCPHLLRQLLLPASCPGSLAPPLPPAALSWLFPPHLSRPLERLQAFVDESMRTLQYAASAGAIRNRPTVKLDPQQQLITQLQQEVEQLKQQAAPAAAPLQPRGHALPR